MSDNYDQIVYDTGVYVEEFFVSGSSASAVTANGYGIRVYAPLGSSAVVATAKGYAVIVRLTSGSSSGAAVAVTRGTRDYTPKGLATSASQGTAYSVKDFVPKGQSAAVALGSGAGLRVYVSRGSGGSTSTATGATIWTFVGKGPSNATSSAKGAVWVVRVAYGAANGRLLAIAHAAGVTQFVVGEGGFSVGIVLTTNSGMQLIPIEDSATTSLKNKVIGSAINACLICDGPDPISFTAVYLDGSTQTFTLKSGEKDETPWVFKELKWKLKSGSASDFRQRACLYRG